MDYENNRNLAKCLPELKNGDDGQILNDRNGD